MAISVTRVEVLRIESSGEVAYFTLGGNPLVVGAGAASPPTASTQAVPAAAPGAPGAMAAPPDPKVLEALSRVDPYMATVLKGLNGDG